MADYTFAELLKGFLAREEVTQSELASRLGKPRSTISNWCAGNYLPRYPQDIAAVAEVLSLNEVDTNQLMIAAGFAPRIKTPSGEQNPTRIPASKAARLVGREDDLAWLRQRLRAGGQAALAGVRGIGGIGKTELAIAIANELHDELPGGVIWLAAGANELYAIQEQMARHLGLPQLPEPTGLQARRDALALALAHYPRALVVVDDLRGSHIPDFDLLKPPPPHALLVTSRHKDLPLPPGGLRLVGSLPQAEAETLLRDVLDDRWAAAEPEMVAAIADFLEGIPLALWLAGRRAWVINERRDGSEKQPLATLYRELKERRRVLVLHESDKRSDLSVLVTFDLSVDELDEAGQQRLARLGVFAQGLFLLAGLAKVWGAEPEAAREYAKPLANAGLLEEQGADLWWMHDLLREYCGERFKKLSVTTQVETRLGHATFLQKHLDNLPRLSLDDWGRLNLLWPEVEQATKWLLIGENWQAKPRLAASLAWSLDNQYQIYIFPNGETWLRTGLKAAENDQWETGIGVLRSKLADLLRTRGQYDEAERLYRLSLDVFEKLGDSREVAVTQSSLADLLRTRGQYDEAERLYRSGLATCQQIREPQGIGVFWMGLGQLALVRGQREEAAALFTQAQDQFLAIGLPNWAAQAVELLRRLHET